MLAVRLLNSASEVAVESSSGEKTLVLNLDLKLQLSIANLLEVLLSQSAFADINATSGGDDEGGDAESEGGQIEAAAGDAAEHVPSWQPLLESEDMNPSKGWTPQLPRVLGETPNYSASEWLSETLPVPSAWESLDVLPVGGGRPSDEELWLRRANARRRQIQNSKSRPEYLRYISQVNKEDRLATHPRTPSPTHRISKRQFDRELSEWRQKLRLFDGCEPDLAQESSELHQHVQGLSQSKPCPIQLFPHLYQ